MRASTKSITPSSPARVLIVDDSSMTRWLMKQILDGDPEIHVVGTAEDAAAARRLIQELNPDVITLDVEMPGVNGIDFLRNLMRARPMPVVMVSSLTQRGAKVTLDALSLGAVDFVSKPKSVLSAAGLADYTAELTEKVKIASTANVHAPSAQTMARAAAREPCDRPPATPTDPALSSRIVALGASTGGTEALFEILLNLPPDGDGVVIVQHITPAFNKPFVERLDRSVPIAVRSPTQGELIRRGHVYVAPEERHMKIKRAGSGFACHLVDGDPVHFQRPSVDVLFASVAEQAGPNALGVILTGMGSDGADGLLEMRRAGAFTIAQDEDSSVVWGMPGAAVTIGAASEVTALDDIAELIAARSGKH